MTYMTGDAVLFHSNDAFGQHYRDGFPRHDEVDQTELFEQMPALLRQYPDAVQPSGNAKNYRKSFNLPVDMIATTAQYGAYQTQRKSWNCI